MGIVHFDWTPNRVQTLRDKHAEGMSFSQIGTILGTTRNSAIGKARRLKLPERETTREAYALHHRRPARPNLTIVEKPEPVAALTEFLMDGQRITTETVCWWMCHWPLGEHPDIYYCAHPCAPDRSYCAYHQSIAIDAARTQSARRNGWR